MDGFPDRFAITWDGMLHKGSGQVPNRFQLVAFTSGDLQMTWLQVDQIAHLSYTTAGYVTLAGNGRGHPPLETDFLP